MNVDRSFKKIPRDFQIRNWAPRRLRASQINPLKSGVPIKGFRGIGGSVPTRGWLTPSSRRDSSDKKISILFRVANFTPLSWTSPKPHEKPLAWKKLLVACKRCFKTVKKIPRAEISLQNGFLLAPTLLWYGFSLASIRLFQKIWVCSQIAVLCHLAAKRFFSFASVWLQFCFNFASVLLHFGFLRSNAIFIVCSRWLVLLQICFSFASTWLPSWNRSHGFRHHI